MQALKARVHATNFDVLLVLVTLHVTVMAIYRWRLKKNLVGAMITGRQRLHSGEGIAGDRLLLALVMAGVAAGLVWTIVSSAPEPDPSALFY